MRSYSDAFYFFLFYPLLRRVHSDFSVGCSVLSERKNTLEIQSLSFLGYILFLFLISGLRFYFYEIVGLENYTIRIIIRILYVTGYSLLIYYLPATINYLLKRPWTRNRLTWIILSAVSYFAAGLFVMFKGLSPIWNLPLGAFFFFAFVFVLVDALRSLPLIRDKRGRMTVTLLFTGTFLFLPVLLLVRITGGFFYPLFDNELLLFPVQTIYYLWLAVVLIGFLMNRILISDAVPLPLSEKPLSFFEDLGITSREREIILFLEKGLTYKEIARELFISANTVSNHVASIYKKTGQRSRVEMLNSLRGEA